MEIRSLLQATATSPGKPNPTFLPIFSLLGKVYPFLKKWWVIGHLVSLGHAFEELVSQVEDWREHGAGSRTNVYCIGSERESLWFWAEVLECEIFYGGWETVVSIVQDASNASIA